MLFVLIGWDTPDSKEKRPIARPDHLAHWTPWDEAGKIVIAGPLTDFAGSLFIVDCESEEEARKQMESDPYIAAGVFKKVECHPFKKVFPM
jgi:uncharacterized protein YciI